MTRIVGVVGLGLIVANCANNQGGRRYASSREVGAFPESKYGKASPRVVADGEPVPKGGGRYLVGKSYSVAGRRYTPNENPSYSAVGTASWYGEAFHGRRTANGEVYDMASFTAAHPTLPLPSYARVTNLLNHRSMIVRVNDRGPFHAGRVMDVSERVAYYLDFKRFGTARIKVDYVGPASTAGSDDRRLLATLRTDGDLAPSPLRSNPVMMASADLGSNGEAQPNPVVAAPARATVLASNDAPSEPPIFTPEPTPQQSTSVAFKPASGIPLPPDRPFEVGAGKGGFPSQPQQQPIAAPQPQPQIAQVQPATRAPEPVAIAAAPSAPQALGYATSNPQPVKVPIGFTSNSSTLAALYYAEPMETKSRFAGRADPMARIKTANMVPLSAVPTPARGEFVVLAGIFHDAANARRLAAAMGKHATVKTIAGNGAAVYQVTAGPFASTSEAQATRDQAVRAGAADARVTARQG